MCTYCHFNPVVQWLLVCFCFCFSGSSLLCLLFVFCFFFFCGLIFFCSNFELLPFCFWGLTLFLICGFDGVQVCCPLTLSTCFKLIIIEVQTHSNRSIFYTPLPHILWFWCPILYLHAYAFIVCFKYNCF